ncbi:hypothetical protein A1Q2_02444 [Trichosporon asahii var. asahii CBS 8904]|uniref:Uncharacterized protein n=1 Tax=Trichosporon asahii var. asahii (strain CBS 8904) TaxID=1220162 RepID=K1W2V2_TRIAC|nr:hypothetical protein A1Q2_02444 [Trichosporon asahii var. asahii CBS 8904]
MGTSITTLALTLGALASAHPAHKDNSTFRLVYDDFSSGFDVGLPGSSSKWVYYADTTGQFVGNDGIETVGPEGLTVVSKGVNNVTGKPAFTHTAPPDRPDSDNLEHVKYMAFPNVQSSHGYPGWDVAQGHVFSCEGHFGAEMYGVDDGPFQEYVPWNNYAAFGSGSFVFGDFEAGWIFHLVLSNDRYYAAYERLAFSPDHEYASFTYLIPIAKREACDIARLRVEYDRDAQEVAWFIDGREKLRLGGLGWYKDEFKDWLAMDRGGKEEDKGDLNQLQCGFALISTLDAFLHKGKGKGKAFVRMNQTPGYYRDPRTHGPDIEFIDQISTPQNQIWGQGGKMTLRELIVESRPKRRHH